MLDVLMLYAIKLGPIETSEGRVSAYVGFTETHALPPVVSNQDKDGLEQLAQQAQGHDLRCDRGLARAGKPLGFTAAPLPDWARFGGRLSRSRSRVQEDVFAIWTWSKTSWRAWPPFAVQHHGASGATMIRSA